MSPALRFRERLETQPKPPIPTFRADSNLGEDQTHEAIGRQAVRARTLAGNTPFRSLKGIDLDVRPIHHHLTGRVKARVFLCMVTNSNSASTPRL